MTESIDKLLTVEDVMENLRISRPTLYRLLKSNRLVPVRIGKRTLFDPKDIRAFVESSKGTAEPPPKKKQLREERTKKKRGAKTHQDTPGDTLPTPPHGKHEKPKIIPKEPADSSDGQGRLL